MAKNKEILSSLSNSWPEGRPPIPVKAAVAYSHVFSTFVHPHVGKKNERPHQTTSYRRQHRHLLRVPTAHLDDAGSNQAHVLGSHWCSQLHTCTCEGFSFISRSRRAPTVLRGFNMQIYGNSVCFHGPEPARFMLQRQQVQAENQDILRKYSG